MRRISETGIEPILYMDSNYARKNVNASVAKYDLWFAHWTYDQFSSPDTGIWENWCWDFWQWSDKSAYAPLGYVPGVTSDVDLDVFNGDIRRLHVFL